MCLYEVISHTRNKQFVYPFLHHTSTPIHPNAPCKIGRYTVAATKEVSVSPSLPRVREGVIERDWTTLTLNQKCEVLISNRKRPEFVMDRKREAESAKRGNEEYYGFSPLGFMGDSYFTQTPYYANNSNETARVGIGFEPSTNYPGPAPQVVQPTGYPPYYPQTPMDLDVLSAENYQTQRDYAQVSSMQQRGREHAPMFGITADNRTRTITPSPPAGTRARRSRKESLKTTSADEANSARQRGRPRLETKDQTAAEVCNLSCFGMIFCNLLPSLGLYLSSSSWRRQCTSELT